jgi:intracellular multiplication protein IcmK
MYKANNKKIIILIVGIFFCLFNIVWAEESSTASEDVAPLSQAEIDQFQAWLKNSKEHRSDPVKIIKKKESPVYTTEVPALITKEGAYEDTPAVISPPMSYKKSQEMMLQSAPKSSAPPSQDSIDAFNAMMQQNVPLTPQQVVKLRQLIDQSQRAASIPATVPPKPVSSTLIMNLAPGTTPPAIRLAQGYVTSLVFVDSTGSPWPISSYDLGNQKAANIQWDQKSNIILIQAIAPYGDSDLIIRLVGLPTPLTLELVSGQRVVDYRTDIHVPGIGPNTKDLPIGTSLPGSANQLLLNVLDGIAPPGSRPMTVIGGDALVWLLGDRMYLRSRLTVLSPGWTGRMVSPDGMMAYEIPKSSTVLVSQYGQPIELKIEGF